VAVRVQPDFLVGGRVTQEVRDVGGGKLIASVADADGNVIGLLQPPG
jgi:predicted enzyme related to lactoylglutathione lyase